MQSLTLFLELFGADKVPCSSACKPSIDAVASLPCERSLREIDDLLADLGKALEGPIAFITLVRVRAACSAIGLTSSCFVKVPAEYYDRDLEWRRKTIGAPSVDCLCKSLILENTECTAGDCSDPTNARFYCVCVQYVSKLDTQKVFNFVRSLGEGRFGKRDYHFRMADSERALELTGFEHNAICPIGMRVPNVPIILAQGIAELQSKADWFWLGGGQVDLKLGFKISEFIAKLKPFVVDVYKL